MFYSTRWHRVKKKRRIAQCQTSSRFLICGITMKSCGILPGRSCFSAPKRSRTIDVVDIEESENNRAMRKLLALRTYCLNHSCGALCIIPAPLSRMFVTILDFAASVYCCRRANLSENRRANLSLTAELNCPKSVELICHKTAEQPS